MKNPIPQRTKLGTHSSIGRTRSCCSRNGPLHHYLAGIFWAIYFHIVSHILTQQKRTAHDTALQQHAAETATQICSIRAYLAMPNNSHLQPKYNSPFGGTQNMNGDERSPTRRQRCDDAILNNENMSVVCCNENKGLHRYLCHAKY